MNLPPAKPVRYPDLSDAKALAFDTETYDPHLDDMGPGVYRRDGKLLGVSISDGRFKEYYNLGHYDCTAAERKKNLAYLRRVLKSKAVKVGQRLIYDVDWLENGEHEVKVAGPLKSVEVAEALLDENQGHYSLEFMAQKYFGESKRAAWPQRFCEENGLKGDFRRWLWKMPYDGVREYGAEDADLPLRVLELQEPRLASEDMSALFELENELTRCLLKMRRTGVRIDADKRDRAALWAQNFLEEHEQKLYSEHGEFNYNSSAQVAAVLDKLGIPYPRTEKKAPSITAGYVKTYREQYPILREIDETRRAYKTINTFLLGALKEFVTPDGLIHASFYNTRVDEYGTRSGRFSSAHPNLQQVPSKERKSRGERMDELCREAFVPFDDCWWLKLDYSQIEYRFMAHFAVGPGSDELRAAYNSDADIDYHDYIMRLTGLGRGLAKNLNFGIAYGMGAARMAATFGWDLAYCRSILKTYHEKATYVRPTMELVMRVAKRRGYIRTFLNRRSRLLDPQKAYIMYCRLMQGSAADLMKKAMLDCYRAGLFDVLHPHLTVHDELDVSVPKSRVGLEAAREMHNVMQTCLKLAVPIKAEPETGPCWGLLADCDFAELEKEIA